MLSQHEKTGPCARFFVGAVLAAVWRVVRPEPIGFFRPRPRRDVAFRLQGDDGDQAIVIRLALPPAAAVLMLMDRSASRISLP